MHRKNSPERACIASYVGPRAFAPQTRAALEGLGYSVVPAFSMGRFDDASWQPALRIVDERQYQMVPSFEDDPSTPLILLTGTRRVEVDDERVAGRAPRPARLSDLYPIIQSALEPTPRQSPRVPTQLSARGIRRDHRWVGHVVSLSEGGCLLRSSEPLDAGATMNLQFALPRSGILTTRATCVHGGDDVSGLVFRDPPPEVRDRIAGFVTQRLATL